MDLFGFKFISEDSMVEKIPFRTHRRTRIQKKWMKRYGFQEVPMKKVYKVRNFIIGHPYMLAQIEEELERRNNKRG